MLAAARKNAVKLSEFNPLAVQTLRAEFKSADRISSELNNPNSDFYERKWMVYLRKKTFRLLVWDENDYLFEIDLDELHKKRKEESNIVADMIIEYHNSEILERALKYELQMRREQEESVLKTGEDSSSVHYWLGLIRNLGRNFEIASRLPASYEDNLVTQTIFTKDEARVLYRMSRESQADSATKIDNAYEECKKAEQVLTMFDYQKFDQVVTTTRTTMLNTELPSNDDELTDKLMELQIGIENNQGYRHYKRQHHVMNWTELFILFKEQYKKVFSESAQNTSVKNTWLILWYKYSRSWFVSNCDSTFGKNMQHYLVIEKEKKYNDYNKEISFINTYEQLLSPISLQQFEQLVGDNGTHDRRLALLTLLALLNKGKVQLNSRALEAALHLYCGGVVTDRHIQFLQEALKNKVEV